MTHAYRLSCGCVGLGQPGLTTGQHLECPSYHGQTYIAGFGIAVTKLLKDCHVHKQ